jgi:signal transduction histidine kinase
VTEVTRAWILRTLVVIGMGLGLTGLVLALVNGTSSFFTLVPLALAPFAFSVWVLAPRESNNRLIWVLAWFVLLVSLYPFGVAVGTPLWPSGEVPGFGEPIPPNTSVALLSFTALYQGLASTGGYLLLTFGLLLFPDGRLPSRRWRWVGWLVGSIVAAWSLVSLYGALPGNYEMSTESVAGLAYMLVTFSPFPALVSLVVRYRQSTFTIRNQIKWIVWGAFALVSASFVSAAGGPEIVGISGIAVFGTAYGIAISRYRLYDIDVVISRTLVYGALAVFIGGVYVAIAVGPWIVLGSEARNNTWLGVLATVVVAVSFQPLRRWLQGVANRIVFGRRATPYEVLSSFSQAVSAVDPGVLTEVARSLVDGTTAHSASIWIDRGDHLQCIAAWPELPESGPDPSAVSEPVVHEGEELGRVVLEIPPGQPFSVPDQRLLEQVAGGLGLALRNLQLTEDLRDRVDELALSRRRIISVQDETRRKLERDLHDGAQQRLVALKIKLGIGSSMAEKAGLGDVKIMIDTVREETDQTIDSVRDFARGIYPPLLEAEGLGQALNAQARRMPIPVTVQAAGLGRYPKEQEATVYFCVLEALQNALKHSGAGSVQVLLIDQEGGLSFEVRDDGVGFDNSEVLANGLINMKDRVEAISGEFGVDSEPGRGTRVFGSVPARASVTT